MIKPTLHSKHVSECTALWIVLGLVATFALILFSGCSTVTPKAVQSSQASYSGNEKNSGVWAYSKATGAIVDQNWVDRYNALVKLWGSRFHPALKQGDGVRGPLEDLANLVYPPGSYYQVDNQHFEKKAMMEAWVRKGEKP